MKKFALLTAPVLTMGVAALCADGFADNSFGEQNTGFVAQQNGQQSQSTQPTGDRNKMPMREVAPETEPKVTHWADPFLTTEFIYWKAYMENIHYAYTGAFGATNHNADEGRLHTPEMEWEPGFKFGFGLKFRHDGWDLYANWTWLSEFEGDSHAETDDDLDSIAHAYGNAASLPQVGVYGDTTFDEGKSNWSMHFNALDLELGRNFYISRFLTLRPHFGLKFGWIDQDRSVKLEDFSVYEALGASAIVPPSLGSVKFDQDFFGVGIRTGLDTVWYFTKHWGLCAEFAFSALWSDFESEREDHFATNSIAKVKSLNFEHDFNTITEVLELGIGLRYDTTFFAGDYEFYLQAGWEEQIWFNQNQFLDTIDTRSGNLTFQGFNLKAGLMF